MPIPATPFLAHDQAAHAARGGEQACPVHSPVPLVPRPVPRRRRLCYFQQQPAFKLLIQLIKHPRGRDAQGTKIFSFPVISLFSASEQGSPRGAAPPPRAHDRRHAMVLDDKAP
ncbi:MAG TPA: hypothetical protein VK980_19520, partial [Sphingomonas sp.]|nr:hypothetical protein [Sphingomonas sp.]